MTNQVREGQLRQEEAERRAEIIPLMERQVEAERRAYRNERIMLVGWALIGACAVIGGVTMLVLHLMRLFFR